MKRRVTWRIGNSSLSFHQPLNLNIIWFFSSFSVSISIIIPSFESVFEKRVLQFLCSSIFCWFTSVHSKIMGSEQNDGTSYQPSEPKLCVNNCGFFGSAGTENLCSKCYRDSRIEAEQAASAKAAMEKSLQSKILKPTEGNSPVSFSDSSLELILPSSSSSTGIVDKSLPLPGISNRCWSCNKKVGLMGFKCKCELTFCGTHRYPEKHNCCYDFKSIGREEIAVANPVVKADKVERF